MFWIRRRITSFNRWRGSVGLAGTFYVLLARAAKKLRLYTPAVWRVHPLTAQHPLTARLHNSSDVSCFNQVFVRQEYACLRDLKNVSLVLDLGANVGFTSAYFLSCFSNSRVLAVEPDERNLAVCRNNLMPYGSRALLLHGAAWSERTRLSLLTGVGDGLEWSTRVTRPADGKAGDIQAWDVPSLIKMAGAEKVDLLKVDIERAELAVFGKTAGSWLPRIRNICIELHGDDCRESFFNTLANFDYDLGYSGDLTICRNLGPKSAA